MSKPGASDRSFAVVNPAAIRVQVRPVGSSAEKIGAAQLKQISPVGAVLLLSEPPRLEGGCLIELESDKLAQPLLIHARVDWLRPDSAGSWHLCCTIEPQMAEGDFRRLLASGLLERRSAPREESRIQVEIQLAPGGPRLAALIRNISLSGVCCLATNCPPEGTRHINIFATHSRIPLKVHWWTQAGTEFFLGCEFVHKADFATLRRLQTEQNETPLDAVPSRATT
jgi:hypothetical protein